MTVRMTSSLTVSAVLFVSTACAGSSQLDIGDGHTVGGPLGASLTDYAGAWEGYAEAYNWTDGSDRFQIKLDATGSGTLRVGAAPDLAPPDPAHAYPPGSENPHGMNTLAGPLEPGYPYKLLDAKVESQRIRFKAEPSELYREWCAMQPSYPDVSDPRTYNCVANFSWGQPDPNAAPVCKALNGRPGNADDPWTDGAIVDCGQGLTCIAHCICNQAGCITWERDDVRLDAALSDGGEALQGTLVINDLRIVVRLTRK